MASGLKILALEPYFGGVHAAMLEGLRRRSRHRWVLLTMPAGKWPWRMRGAALHLAAEAKTLAHRGFDLVFASNFLNVADWKALAPEPLGRLPVITYFHENQLSPPAEPGQERDAAYGFINLTTCLASQEAWFNSAFHRDGFLEAARRLLKKMPDFVPEGLVESVAAKSRAMPPGMDLGPFRAGRRRAKRTPPLVILWNHRWEYDKDPETFFETLFFLAQEGVPFRLSVVGEAYRKWPPIFAEAKRRLADRFIQFGYLPDRKAYEDQVRRSDIVVSTARNEFFGLPVVEAVAAGCFPLVPDGLSYREIVPRAWHRTFLYRSERELRTKLARLLKGEGPWDLAARLADHVERYDWSSAIGAYDEALERAAGGLKSTGGQAASGTRQGGSRRED